MRITRLFVDNFRNLSSVLVDFNKDINIILGANGQGKTNLLEAIYYLGTGRSHRTSRVKELINKESEENPAVVQVKLKRSENIEDKLSLRLEAEERVYKINDDEVERLEHFTGKLNVVLFSPEDLKLVKGSPSQRRDFIDVEVSQVNSSYYRRLKRYEKILRQRNDLLKDLRAGRREKDELITVFTEQLVELGSEVVAKRQEVVEKLKILARLHQRKLTDNEENLRVNYELSFPVDDDESVKDAFKRELNEKINKEIERGYTLCGPHRDDLKLELNGEDVRKYGSQGQQRTVALALKLSELEFMKSESGEYPVLLLDDVFSELDSRRRELLMEFIGSRVQTFLTTTDRVLAEEVTADEKHFYKIEQGVISQGW